VNFEVFGKVQGVLFRKYAQEKAKELGLIGWVSNTEKYTVVGQAQGPKDKIELMKQWLSKEGSPSSKIEKFEFTEASDDLKMKIFEIRE